MMIETISKLAHRLGAERVSIEIPPSNGGNVRLMLVTTLGHQPHVMTDEKTASLAATLAQPIVVSGNVGEVESRLVRLIDELEEGMVSASAKLPDTDARKRLEKLEQAAESGTESDTSNSGTDSKATKKKTAAKKKSDKADFASGEAASL